MNATVFTYGEGQLTDGVIVSMPAGLTDRAQIFDAFRTSLPLPAYFGENWDALDECLRDLSWIQSERIFVIHQDIPALEASALKIYLKLLAACALYWEQHKGHELIINFPPESRKTIEEILGAEVF